MSKLVKKEKSAAVSTEVIIASLQKKAAPILRKLPEVIKTKEQYEDAAANMKALKLITKIAKAEKDDIIVPINKGVARIKQLFAPFEEKMEAKEREVKTLMLEYIQKTEVKVLAIAEALDTGKIKKATTAVRKQNEVQVNSNQRSVWTLVEVDSSKTPSEFLIPDEAAIKEALKEGRKVAGWKWEQVKQIVI